MGTAVSPSGDEGGRARAGRGVPMAEAHRGRRGREIRSTAARVLPKLCSHVGAVGAVKGPCLVLVIE